jgi:hypothetical protein
MRKKPLVKPIQKTPRGRVTPKNKQVKPKKRPPVVKKPEQPRCRKTLQNRYRERGKCIKRKPTPKKPQPKPKKPKNNNGHGNNADGVDVSNPGRGKGGPNGKVDRSGKVDDEVKGGRNRTRTRSRYN